MVKRNREHQEISLEQWAELRADETYWLVAEDHVGGYLVRTVWEGMDELPGLPGSMFTTGVAPEGSQRFSTVLDTDTEQAAQDLHERVVAYLPTDPGGPGLIARLHSVVGTPAESR